MVTTRTRRWGAGKAAMVRHLYASQEPVTQVELAAHAGVSQPAVSQYLSSLRENSDVSFADPGWLANRVQLPASYWQSYASRFTSASCWYRIDNVTTQVSDLVERQPELIVSGDVAADAVLPWKVPAIAIVYGSVEASLLDELGFVSADTAATATVLVRPVPDDSFVNDALDANALHVAARLHLVADLIGLGGDDRLEAAERFARFVE
jgi:transcriptional regulator with XRE-family HTH domain